MSNLSPLALEINNIWAHGGPEAVARWVQINRHPIIREQVREVVDAAAEEWLKACVRNVRKPGWRDMVTQAIFEKFGDKNV
jgi:hypothetical protein